jgi:hypothetical protein
VPGAGEIIGIALGGGTAFAFAYLISKAAPRFLELSRERKAIRAGFDKLGEIYGDVVCIPQEAKKRGQQWLAGEGRFKASPSLTDDVRTHRDGASSK